MAFVTRLKRKIRSTMSHSRASASVSSSGSGSAGVAFKKYHGLGNDFILIDNRSSTDPLVTSDAAVQLCDRHRGIGGDGVIFLLPPGSVEVPQTGSGVDASMRIFNSDGTEPEMCGNGIRCLAKFMDGILAEPAAQEGEEERVYNVATLAGIIRPRMKAGGDVEVDMGPPTLEPSQVPSTLTSNFQADGVAAAAVRAPVETSAGTMYVTCVSMGNPHCLIYVDSLDDVPFETLGPEMESNTSVFPAKTNVEFVEVVRRDYVKMKVWERGAGPTQACGTGACATVVAGVLEGKVDEKCTVLLPGGELHIFWDRTKNTVFMTGPAELVFEGQL